MSEGKKILLIAAGVLLTIAMIFLGVTIYNKGESTITESTSKYDSLASQFGDAELVMYDNGTASGSDVLNLLSNLDSATGYTVIVTNGKGTETTYDGAVTTGDDALDVLLANAKKKRDNAYINPYATFTSKLNKDENGVVESVEFKQVQ